MTRITRTLAMALATWASLLLAGCGDSVVPGDYRGEARTIGLVLPEDLSGAGEMSLADIDWVTTGPDRSGALISVIFAKATLQEVTGFQVDFITADGARPGEQPGCAAWVPVDGAMLNRGLIDPVTRNLGWMGEVPEEFARCLTLSDVATLVFTRK